MTKALLHFSFLLLLLSCTVTKRVHLAGYHVVWHKQQRESEKHQQEKVEEFALELEKNENGVHTARTLETVDDLHTRADLTITDQETSARNPPEENTAFLDRSSNSQFSKSTQRTSSHSSAKTQTVKQKIRPILWRIDPETLRLIGAILIILGGLILLGVLFTYLGAFSGNNDGGWLNFFLDLFSISGWFWLLIFVFLLLLIFFLLYLLIEFVLGGPLIAFFIGIGLLGTGLFLYFLGQNRLE